jgi:hypothetical protein
MKKKIVLTSCFILIISIAIGFKTYNYNNTKKDKVSNLTKLAAVPLLKSADSSTVKKFKVNCSANENQATTAKVYKVRQIDAKIKSHDLANKFNIKIKSEKQDGNIYSVSSEEGSILVSNNGGGFVYYNNKNLSNNSTGNVPNNDECIYIATSFLKNLNLYDNNLKANKISENFVEYKDKKKEVESKDVYFSFKIDGIAVNSGNIIVQVGKSGNILSVVYNKKELELINEYPVISKEEAINQANVGQAVYSSDKNLGETAYVNNISMVYLDNGPFSEQYTEYHPIYILEGSVDSPESNDKFLAQVRAIKSEYVNNASATKNDGKELKLKNSVSNQCSDISLNDAKINNKISIENIIKDILNKDELSIVSYGSVEEVTVKMNDQLSNVKFLDIKYSDNKSKFNVVKDGKDVNLKNSDLDIERIVIPLDQSINKIYMYSKDKAIIVKLSSNDYVTKLLEALK